MLPASHMPEKLEEVSAGGRLLPPKPESAKSAHQPQNDPCTAAEIIEVKNTLPHSLI